MRSYSYCMPYFGEHGILFRLKGVCRRSISNARPILNLWGRKRYSEVKIQISIYWYTEYVPILMHIGQHAVCRYHISVISSIQAIFSIAYANVSPRGHVCSIWGHPFIRCNRWSMDDEKYLVLENDHLTVNSVSQLFNLCLQWMKIDCFSFIVKASSCVTVAHVLLKLVKYLKQTKVATHYLVCYVCYVYR